MTDAAPGGRHPMTATEFTTSVAGWPEWLTPDYSAIHTLVENGIKEGTRSVYQSADAAGMPWTSDGMISVQASSVLAALRDAGWTPPATIDPVDPLPLPEDDAEGADGDMDLTAVAQELLDDAGQRAVVCHPGEANIDGALRQVVTMIVPADRALVATLVTAARKAQGVLTNATISPSRRRAMALELGRAVDAIPE